MYLTREEERMLAGEEGPAKQIALEAIVRVGEALGAEKLVEIKHAHVSGVSYGTIGRAGLAFLEWLAEQGARVTVPTTLNPVGYDTSSPELVTTIPGVRLNPEFVKGQTAILRALSRMGVKTTLTCTPYYLPDVSTLNLTVGDSVAWGESSAIAYANSVLGLKTNREGGPLALLAAIAGRTYYWGMHVDEERRPTIRFLYTGGVLDDARAGIFGSMVAETTRGIPLVEARFSDEMALREFLAALGTSGAVPRAVIPGITPDYDGSIPQETIEYDKQTFEAEAEKYKPVDKPDIIFIGCPHAKAEDVARLAHLILRQGGPRRDVKIVATLSRSEALKLQGEESILKAGITVVSDTCLIVSPFGRGDYKPSVATNSFKAYFYLSARGVPVGIADLEELAKLASRGA